MNFMNILSDNMNRTVADIGYQTATPIQEKAIPVILEGRDIIGQAQTGTGKTAAFAIPILERINTKQRRVQALVLCPTRELALQTAESFRKLSRHLNGVQTLAVYGGQSIERQIRILRSGVQVVIGTPGRLKDHLNRGTLRLDGITVVTLDEADEMLDMGFRDDIRDILSRTPASRQTLLFSATMPKEILDLARSFQKHPEHLQIENKTVTVEAVDQFFMETREHTKIEVISQLVRAHAPELALVFCNTKRRVDQLAKAMRIMGHRVEGLHGDMSQRERDAVMFKFRSRSIDVLVATDVAARGIDVKDVQAVFNYDLPQNAEYYVHRIGRTGRAGQGGKAFSLVVGKERFRMLDIQKATKAMVKQLPVPTMNAAVV